MNVVWCVGLLDRDEFDTHKADCAKKKTNNFFLKLYSPKKLFSIYQTVLKPHETEVLMVAHFFPTVT